MLGSCFCFVVLLFVVVGFFVVCFLKGCFWMRLFSMQEVGQAFLESGGFWMTLLKLLTRSNARL